MSSALLARETTMKDQVIIVTGASRGIGRATAVALAKLGGQIIAASRSPEGLAETAALIAESGGRCHTVAADLANYDAVKQLVASTAGDFGRIDVLINNAGLAGMWKIEESDVDTFDRMMAINCNAVFYACREVWPIMMRQGGGRIVNITSVAAIDPFAGFQAYGATKAWVNRFTEALATEGRPHNIQVFGVGPGAVDTQMLRQYFPDYPDDQCLRPEKIADAVTWILDPRSAHASGSIVYVKKS